MFLSPRQLHVLLELAHGLASPDLEDVSNVVPRRYTEKPMASSDFNRIEHELIHQTHPMQDLKTTVCKFIYILMHFYVYIIYAHLCLYNICLCKICTFIYYRIYGMLKDGLLDL